MKAFQGLLLRREKPRGRVSRTVKAKWCIVASVVFEGTRWKGARVRSLAQDGARLRVSVELRSDSQARNRTWPSTARARGGKGARVCPWHKASQAADEDIERAL